MDKTQLSNFDSHPDDYWRDALVVALATHPDRTLRELIGILTTESVEHILDALPDGLFTLVRRCVDLVACNTAPHSYGEELLAIIDEKLTGKLPEFDRYILEADGRGCVVH